ncbi:hypothetical protein AAT19DRAFT_8650 [Rhodotorula toruloides]|uniref:Uncharacterized protein n=1 Tax=Rhodotorula toruloides TaxID=5286 RepID=A0A2T0AHV4_RHOTO|nr:hypothetical protein AAT19DRAFT_8650 [Rhodotorula toruloides]
MGEMSVKRLWCTRRASPGGRIAARERGGRPRRSSWRLSSSPRRHTLRPGSRRAHDPLHDLLTPVHDPLARSHARNDPRRLFSSTASSLARKSTTGDDQSRPSETGIHSLAQASETHPHSILRATTTHSGDQPFLDLAVFAPSRRPATASTRPSRQRAKSERELRSSAPQRGKGEPGTSAYREVGSRRTRTAACRISRGSPLERDGPDLF